MSRRPATTAAAVDRVVHVTRLPPSPSGVAAYAESFGAVLTALTSPDRVDVERLPPEPASSQSALLALRLSRRLSRRTRGRTGDVVLIEQAGRGLAEFWAAWWLTVRGRRVWLMVHDVPELSGGAFFSTLLDRRGGRRVAAALSGSLGRAAERGLLARAERVLCLSPAGARALERAHGLTRTVQDVPHVALPVAAGGTPPAGRREVLAPGYVAGADDVLPLVPAVTGWPDGWTLTVGACSADAEDEIRAAAARAGVTGRVRLLGFTDEAGVRDAFARAAVVVRWRRDGWGAGGAATARYAVSGPLIAAMAHGCAIVTNDSRGAAHLFHEARVRVVGEGAAGQQDLIGAVATLLADPGERAARAQAGRDLVQQRHSPQALASLLAAAPPVGLDGADEARARPIGVPAPSSDGAPAPIGGGDDAARPGGGAGEPAGATTGPGLAPGKDG